MAKRGRPKGSKTFDPDSIALRVWKAVKSQGYSLHVTSTTGKPLRGGHSLKVAVAAVVKELGCSETTVWNAWRGFNVLKYEMRIEKCRFDFECDIHNECRHGEALESLQREFGNRAEFSHEEVEERAQDLDEHRSYHPDYDPYD
jgi:GTP cyclohydrolase II